MALPVIDKTAVRISETPETVGIEWFGGYALGRFVFHRGIWEINFHAIHLCPKTDREQAEVRAADLTFSITEEMREELGWTLAIDRAVREIYDMRRAADMGRR